jgi:OCT family organic cation transporter-like MFS transporter 4/5
MNSDNHIAFQVVGLATLPLIAYLARHWFTIGVITSIPGGLLLLYWKMLPESPRWLVTQGRTEEAAKILLQIAKTNGREEQLPAPLLESMLKKVVIRQEQSPKENVGLWTLFSRLGLAKNTIMLTISWLVLLTSSVLMLSSRTCTILHIYTYAYLDYKFNRSINGLLYYAITINADNMAGNIFLNFFILAIIEVPAGLLGGYLLDRTGRRWTPVVFFLACVAAFIVAATVVNEPELSSLLIVSIFVSK